MPATHRPHGFTLIEVIVAVLLLSVIALALTTTLISTQRALVASKKRMEATQLAADGLERLRTGQPLDALPSAGGFDRSGSDAPWNGHQGLHRLEVTVSWNDGGPQDVHLATLVRR